MVGLSFVVTLGISGCGKGGPQLGEVSGKVLDKDGKPLPKANVTFQPLAPDSSPSYGTTDEQGVYTLTYTEDRKGAVVGQHTVTVAVPKTDIRGQFQKEVKPGSNTIDLNMKEAKAPPADNSGDSGGSSSDN
jgi:hypothetical protein